MRRSRLPSDSPRIVTRPGVKSNSMALWVTSIQDGMASGRQFTKIGGGRPAFSSANIFSICAAAFGVHGGGLDFTCRSWSVIFGFHTPLQSGSLARSAQSLPVGGGLMTVAGFFAPSAFCSGSALTAAVEIASATTTAPNRYRIVGVSLSEFLKIQISDYREMTSLAQGEADPAAEGDHGNPEQQRQSACNLRRHRGIGPCAPMLDIAAGKSM